tara:strand:- start:2152 stop:2439 length:288 start_codon:yes stop_codon:yes gene_type:complete
MFARVTHYQIKPDSVNEAKALTEKLKPKIMALPGVHSFINMIGDDGKGCVVSLVESRETSEANAQAVQALWANFKDHLADAPTAEGYDVFANWSA